MDIKNREEFRDFYYEMGKYDKRPRGFDEYVKFIDLLFHSDRQQLSRRIEEMRKVEFKIDKVTQIKTEPDWLNITYNEALHDTLQIINSTHNE